MGNPTNQQIEVLNSEIAREDENVCDRWLSADEPGRNAQVKRYNELCDARDEEIAALSALRETES